MDETNKTNDVSSTSQIKEDRSFKDADSVASDQIVKTKEEDLDSEKEQDKSYNENEQALQSTKLKTVGLTNKNKHQSLENTETNHAERPCEKISENSDIDSESSKTKTIGSTELSSNVESRQRFHETDSKGLIQTKNIQPRSILKTTSSEPTIIVTPPPKPPQHSSSSDDFRIKRGKKRYINYLNDTQSVQEFVNPAFELDENVPSDFRLADIVEQVLQQEVSKYQHPFGKGNLYNTVFLGEKSVAHTGGGRFILWFIFAFALVGMAGVIIFMSEIYKSDESGGGNLTSS